MACGGPGLYCHNYLANGVPCTGTLTLSLQVLGVHYTAIVTSLLILLPIVFCNGRVGFSARLAVIVTLRQIVCLITSFELVELGINSCFIMLFV